jgi:hypothetical protein
MVRGSLLQIGENLPQRHARNRPIVGALLQHQSGVADRPAHDFIYETVVHRGARCLSVGENTDEAAANAAPFTSWAQASRFDAGRVTAPDRDGGRRDQAPHFGI